MLNVPVGVVAMVVVALVLRRELVGPVEMDHVRGPERGEGKMARWRRAWDRLATVDCGGQLLFLWGMGLLVLAFTWAGGTYPWDSPAVVASLVVGAVLAVAWVLYEWAMVPGRAMARVFPRQKAMMPWQLLTQRDVGLLLGINFAVGVAMFAVLYFMDLYFTLVRGHSASSAGLALLYFLPGMGGELTPRLPITEGYADSNGSWRLLGHCPNQRLAPPDAAGVAAGQHHLRSWRHGAAVGVPSREHRPHLRHDGTHWIRRRVEHQPGLAPRPGLLPRYDGPHHLPGLLRNTFWRHRRIDHHVDRLQQQERARSPGPQEWDCVGIHLHHPHNVGGGAGDDVPGERMGREGRPP